MTRDEIIEMAKQADLDWHTGWTLDDDQSNRFETFAKLVAEHERMACANICEEEQGYKTAFCALKIRARGKHD